MKRKLSCSVCYEPQWCGGFLSYMPVFFCQPKKAVNTKRLMHRKASK